MGQNIAYYNRVREFEAGWGNRPDGFLVAKTKEQFNDKAKEIKAAGSYAEFSTVEGEPILCLVTDDMAAQLEAKGTVWLNSKDWLVE
jgi:hypothetical protein